MPFKKITSSPYYRLARLHQPAGIWLLLWPCWWSLALADHGRIAIAEALWFLIGAVAMRAAGCIVNDMADRDFDAKVERTRARPLASGELSMHQAWRFLALLLGISCIVAFALGWRVVMWAVVVLPLVVAYPFMKRLTWWPQLFLGLTFNWGALLGCVAVEGTILPYALWLYAGGIFWTLGYDTIYAHQDKRDDALIGVKSTALRLKGHSRWFIALCYALTVACFAMAGRHAGMGVGYAMGLALFAVQLAWQVQKVNFEDVTSCRRIFFSNARVGWVLLLGAISTAFI